MTSHFADLDMMKKRIIAIVFFIIDDKMIQMILYTYGMSEDID